MNEKIEKPARFKALKAFNVGGSDKIVDLVREPKGVSFSNAKGGLRVVSSEDVRVLAKAAAQALGSLTLGTAKV